MKYKQTGTKHQGSKQKISLAHNNKLDPNSIYCTKKTRRNYRHTLDPTALPEVAARVSVFCMKKKKRKRKEKSRE